MIPLLLSTVISCSDAVSILNKLTSVVGLTQQQKIEITSELRKIIPTCPVIVKKDGPKKKQSNRFND